MSPASARLAAGIGRTGHDEGVTTTGGSDPAAPRAAGGQNLADLLRQAAARTPDGAALLGSWGSRSWAELDAAADRRCAEFRDGTPGDRVVLALPTGPGLAAALFGVWRAGLVAVPVDPQRTDIDWVADRVGAARVVTDEMPPGTAKVTAADPARAAGHGEARSGGEDLALLARAARRGPPVMLSHRALIAAARAVAGAAPMSLHPADRVLQALPLFHVVGLVTAFLPAALAGAAVVVPDASAAPAPAMAALAAVRAHRVSVLPAEPTLYRQLDRIDGFERALATVRLMTSGSSPLDRVDFVAIRTATGQAVREGYGISEAAAAVTSTLMVRSARLGSVGLPYPGVEVRIVGDHIGADGAVDATDDEARTPSATVWDELADLAEVPDPDGDVGPIAIRGETLFSGYWPDGARGPDADGWFVTGDVGYLDDAGELHLIDRAAETVTVAGFTVYPREVEDALVKHPMIADAAVVGMPGRGGETVVATLVPKSGKRPTADDIDEFLAPLLPPFKRPTDYRLADLLPRTEVGRLDRDTVRQDFAASRGIELDPPMTLRAADTPADDATQGPERAAGLSRLGRRLPAADTGRQRSARDTDEDLF